MFTKILVPVLALVIAITFSGYIVLTNNQNQYVPRQSNKTVESEDINTSDWLTYRNDEYGFEFKYPNNWILKERSGSIDLYSHETDEFYPVYLTPEGEYKIDISLPSFESCPPSYKEFQSLKEEGRIKNDKWIIVSNNAVYQYDYQTGENITRSYCIPYGDRETINIGGNINQNYLLIYEKIILTIEFDR